MAESYKKLILALMITRILKMITQIVVYFTKFFNWCNLHLNRLAPLDKSKLSDSSDSLRRKGKKLLNKPITGFHKNIKAKQKLLSNGVNNQRFLGFFRNLTVLFLAVVVISTWGIMGPGESFGQESGANSGANTTENNNPIYTVRDSVLSYFYPVSGIIVGVEKELVKVNFLTEKRLKKGMRFSVFREGKPFYHPVTKEPFGKSEEFIGRIEIGEARLESTPTHSEEESYLCSVVNGSPKIGDIVRITSSRIKLAFFQDKKAEWTLSEVFYNSLKDSGRFDFLESYTKTYDPKELSMLARELGAEAVLLFSTPLKDENIFLNVKLFWAEDAATFAEIEKAVGPSLVKELMPEEELISIGSIEEEPWGSYKLAGGEFFAMGDVDGNNERELIVSDGNNIRIYSYKQEPREIWFIKGNPQENILSIDVLDLNKNGRAEIFVTSLRDKNIMNSFVVEYDPSEGYRRIWNKAPYVLRVIGKTLLMQSFTPFKTFTGPVYKGVWKGGHYQTGKPLELPAGINIYGFTYVDWQDNGHSHILAFDDDGYLNLYSSSELIWKSKESYGRFEGSFKRKTYSVVNPEKKWFVKGRLVLVKTKRGQEVIVVKKIPFVSRVPGLGYEKAEVYSLWWDSEVMDKTLVLGGIDGTVTDYWVEGNDLLLIAKPNLLAFLTRVLSGDFVKGSILYYYNLTGK